MSEAFIERAIASTLYLTLVFIAAIWMHVKSAWALDLATVGCVYFDGILAPLGYSKASTALTILSIALAALAGLCLLIGG